MYLAVDIGGTAVKMGLVDDQGAIHARHQASVSFDQYQTPILTTVLHQAQVFLDREKQAVRAIGVSATGQVDDQAGVVIGTNGKIPGYEGSPIKEAFEARFHRPAFVLNDANAAALGECFMGRGKGYDHVLMITLGTGVGGGILCDGRLLRGQRGVAGELGHFTLRQEGPLCPCGKRGCYENYASTSALVRSAREALHDDELDGKGLFDLAGKQDAKALEVLDHWIDCIAEGLTGLIHIFNPQMVLIGGAVSSQEKLLMEPLRRKVLRGVMPRFAENLKVESALLGNDAGLMGAVKFCMDQLERAQER